MGATTPLRDHARPVGAPALKRPFTDIRRTGRLRMPTRIALSHVPPAFVPDGSWFFVTICCARRGENTLCTPARGHAVLNDAATYHRRGHWRLHLLLLMPDHLHAIVAVGCGDRLSEVLRNWKRLTARTHGIEWQRGYFDHRLRAGESLELKARYIRENPVRAGLAARAEDWPWFVDFRTLEGG